MFSLGQTTTQPLFYIKQDGSSCNDTTLFIITTDLAVVPGLVDYPRAKISCREGEHNSKLEIPPL